MPKVYLRETDRIKNNIKEFILGRTKILKLSQKKIADKLGITQQSYSKKMKTLNFDVEELIELATMLEVQEEDLARLFRKERNVSTNTR